MDKLKNAIDFHDLTFILICALCTLLLISGFKYLKFTEGADEGYYLRYATLINENGCPFFPALFKIYISDTRNWIFPNPLRVAFIAISAIWVGIFGKTYTALSFLSLFSYLLTLAISYYFSAKYFGKRIALLFTALLAFSPLYMAMARRALADSTANFFSVLSLWLLFDMVNDRKRHKHFIFAVVFTLAILTKETAVLLSIVFVPYLLVRKYALKKEVLINDLLCATVYPFLAAGAVYLMASCSISHTAEVIKIILVSPSTNRYAILYSSGPWFRYIVDFILLSPWTFLLATGFFFAHFLTKENHEKTLYFSMVFVLYFCSFNFFAKNIRYVMLLDVPIRLFCVLMITKIIENRSIRYGHIFLYIFVMSIALYDYLSFRNLFVIYGIYDPASSMLFKVWRFIPFR